MTDILRVLCLGDVVGRPGRRALSERLPGLRRDWALDAVIANGENAAGGVGLTPETMRELFRAGVDVITSGNHIWKHREMYPLLRAQERVLRPYNYGGAAPGRGWLVLELPGRGRLGVLNLQGRAFMEPLDCPFRGADEALAQLAGQGPDCVVLDFHAEASSEKRAMAHYLDGRVAAMLGTHTHVQTADAAISALGTASLTDLGMCGVEADSVIGMARERVVRRFVTGLPEPLLPAKGEASLNGALLEVDKSTGKALSIRLVRDKPCAFMCSLP